MEYSVLMWYVFYTLSVWYIVVWYLQDCVGYSISLRVRLACRPFCHCLLNGVWVSWLLECIACLCILRMNGKPSWFFFFWRLVGNPISFFFIDCVDCYSLFCMWIVDKFGVLIFFRVWRIILHGENKLKFDCIYSAFIQRCYSEMHCIIGNTTYFLIPKYKQKFRLT
jgi:hypothetical protein